MTTYNVDGKRKVSQHVRSAMMQYMKIDFVPPSPATITTHVPTPTELQNTTGSIYMYLYASGIYTYAFMRSKIDDESVPTWVSGTNSFNTEDEIYDTYPTPSSSSPAYIRVGTSSSGNYRYYELTSPGAYYELTGKMPAPGNIDYGEVAVSYPNELLAGLYIKDSDNTIVPIRPKPLIFSDDNTGSADPGDLYDGRSNTVISYETVGAAAKTHSHGNITSDGKVGTASGMVLTTTTNGLVTASDLSVSDPTASGTSTTFIKTLSQGSNGKVTVAKASLPTATESVAGIATLGASGGAATYEHAHGNITSGGKIGTTAKLAVVTGTDGIVTTSDLSVSDPTASGTATDFIKSISQASDGKVTVAKASLPTATESVAGIATLGASGGAATYEHVHGNITSDGKIGTTADLAVKTTTGGTLTTTDLSVSDPTAAGNTTSFIATISQSSDGKITVTKSTVPDASDTVAGITTVGASGGAADYDHAHGNITSGGKIGTTAKLAVVTGTDGLVTVSDLSGSDPSASGNATSFIATISQDTDGKITATKSTVPDASTTTAGITKVGASGGAASYEHAHGNITSDGKVGTASGMVVTTTTGGAVTASDLTTSDPTASGNGTSFIATISQGSDGKITATKTTVPDASDTVAGITTVGASGGAASYEHTHGNITSGGKIGTTAKLAVVTGTDGLVTTSDLSTSDPTASGNGTSFIATISQDTDGKITATKTTVPNASDTTAGITTVGASGGAASYGHTHGNVTNDGKIGSTADLAVKTTTNGVLTTTDLSASDPTAAGNGTSFIATISQSSDGKITATKTTVPDASDTVAGITTVGASGGAASYEHAHGNITSDGKVGTASGMALTTTTGGTVTATDLSTSDPTASGNGTSFIATISQGADGKISTTKTTVPDASDTTAGITTVGASGGAASYEHAHGNITSDGKIGSTADLVVKTTTSGTLTTADLSTSDPTATGTATSFIATASQSSDGKITVTKSTIPSASDTTEGITKVGASGGAAAYSHAHGNITSAGKIGTTAKLAVVTGTDGIVTTTDLSTSDPTASGTATSFIATASQDSDGKMIITKSTIPSATTDIEGITTLGSSGGAATYEHGHGNIASGGTITSTAVSAASGDYILISDASNSGKVERSIQLSTVSSTPKFLGEDGNWAVPAGTLETVLSMTYLSTDTDKVPVVKAVRDFVVPSVVEVTSATPTITVAENTVYKCSTTLTSLTLDLQGSDYHYNRESIIYFTAGADFDIASTITDAPSGMIIYGSTSFKNGEAYIITFKDDNLTIGPASESELSLITTGDGNVISALSVSDHAITATKGITAVTSVAAVTEVSGYYLTGVSQDGSTVTFSTAQLPSATTTTAGITTVGASGGAAAYSHAHGNITSDGKIGSTAGLAVKTTTGGALTTVDLSVSDPTASGNATSFIATASQSSDGKITVTKSTIPSASDTTAGITKVGASGGAASYEHAHGNITSDGKVGTASGMALTTTTDGLVTASDLTTSDPTASGNGTSFIATISQGTDGKITATKTTVPDASDTVAGITTVGASGGAAAYSHAHGNVTSDGKIGSTADLAVKTTTGGTLTTTNLSTSDPTAAGNATSFIATASQSSDGKITVTKSTIPTASDTTAGITTVGASGGAAAYDHAHGNITSGGKIGTTAKLAVVTGTDGIVTTTDLTTSDPTASGNGTSFIATISQDTDGKITATKTTVPDATSTVAGIVTLGARGGAATHEHVHGSINSDGTITDAAVTPSNGDYIVITDSSASNSVKRGIAITTVSSDPQFLREDGTWAVPGGTLETVSSMTYLSTDTEKVPVVKAVRDFVVPSVVEVTSATPTITVAENTIYKCSTSLTSLTLDLQGSDYHYNRESLVYFTAGADFSIASTITDAPSGMVIYGSTSFKSGEAYLISFKDDNLTIGPASESELSLTTTGDGNVLTGLSVSDHAITATKGITAITSVAAVTEVSGYYLTGVSQSGSTVTFSTAQLPSATTTTAGITTVGASGGAAAYSHAHGNITSDGKVGTTASLALVTGTGGLVSAADLSVSDPTASGTATSFIATASQGTDGKMTLTKASLPTASASTAGITTVGASGGAAAYTHTHGNISADGAISSTAVSSASGDYLLISDTSNSGKIERGIALTAVSSTPKFLGEDGKWAVPAGTLETVSSMTYLSTDTSKVPVVKAVRDFVVPSVVEVTSATPSIAVAENTVYKCTANLTSLTLDLQGSDYHYNRESIIYFTAGADFDIASTITDAPSGMVIYGSTSFESGEAYIITFKDDNLTIGPASESELSLTTTGSGNVLTGLSVSDHAITATKNITAVTSVASVTEVSGYYVSGVSQSGSTVTFTTTALPTASTTTAGITTVGASGGAAAYSHTHGNITSDGKVGSTSGLALVTGTSGAVTTADLSKSDPSASGTSTSFIATLSQGTNGAITATKASLPTASTSTAGIATLGASGGAATYDHVHGNINNNGTMTSTVVPSASGDYILISDTSNSGKVERSIQLSAVSSTPKFLGEDGNWAVPAGTLETVSSMTYLSTDTAKVPVVKAVRDFVIPSVVSVTSATPTITVAENTVYKCTANLTSLTLDLQGSDYSYNRESIIYLTAGADFDFYSTITDAPSGMVIYGSTSLKSGEAYIITFKDGNLTVGPASESELSLTTSGDGNVLTGLSVSDHAITATKGLTAVTSVASVTEVSGYYVTGVSQSGSTVTFTTGTLPSATTSVAGITTVGASGGAAAYTHAHGNISSAGAITSTAVSSASGDYILISDTSNSGKVERGIQLSAVSSTPKFLGEDGKWAVPNGTLETVSSMTYESTDTSKVPVVKAVRDFVIPTLITDTTSTTISFTASSSTENCSYRYTQPITAVTVDMNSLTLTRESNLYFTVGSSDITATISNIPSNGVIYGDTTLKAGESYIISMKDGGITISPFSESELSLTTSGSGNVVSGISVSDHAITVTKGVTALTGVTATTTGNGNVLTGLSSSGGTITGTLGATAVTSLTNAGTTGVVTSVSLSGSTLTATSTALSATTTAGSTPGITFVSGVTQSANGAVTATTNTVRTATSSDAGIVTLPATTTITSTTPTITAAENSIYKCSNAVTSLTVNLTNASSCTRECLIYFRAGVNFTVSFTNAPSGYVIFGSTSVISGNEYMLSVKDGNVAISPFTSDELSLTTSGSGNVVSAISVSDHAITVTKGVTALTGVTVESSGSGNVITGLSASGGTITATMGSALTEVTIAGSGSGNVITGLSASGGTITATMGTALTSLSTSGSTGVITAISASGSSITATSTSLAHNDPTASGTSTTFISTISQSANGSITATKASLPTAGSSTSGVATHTEEWSFTTSGGTTITKYVCVSNS